MEREQDRTELLELGTASTDTLGNLVGEEPEGIGFYTPGLGNG